MVLCEHARHNGRLFQNRVSYASGEYLVFLGMDCRLSGKHPGPLDPKCLLKAVFRPTGWSGLASFLPSLEPREVYASVARICDRHDIPRVLSMSAELAPYRQVVCNWQRKNRNHR